MGKAFGIIKALILGTACSAFAASNYAGSLKITRMYVDGSGVWVGFNSKPADCAGNFWGIHSRMTPTTPGYNQVLALLLTAKATGETIDIWYNMPSGQLSCTDPNFLLQLYGAGFSQ
jgi:hypothetical protein